MGIVVVSRLRKDACLHDLPLEDSHGNRIYGKNKNQWLYTLVELCCWDMEKSQLTDRSDHPWDNEDRRPSHADRRGSISREMLGKKFLAALPAGPDHPKLWTLFQDLLALAA